MIYGGPAGDSTITIDQVSNGWMVRTPYINNRDEQLERQAQLYENMIKAAKKESDPLLDELQGYSAVPLYTPPPAAKISDLKQPNVSVFKTFPEVLVFLAELMQDKLK